MELKEFIERKEELKSFWEGKTACWQMCHCPPMIREDCPATRFTHLPCWEIEGTYCKLKLVGQQLVGTDTSICEVCRVYRRWSEGQPIELKLTGQGIDRGARYVEVPAETEAAKAE